MIAIGDEVDEIRQAQEGFEEVISWQEEAMRRERVRGSLARALSSCLWGATWWVMGSLALRVGICDEPWQVYAPAALCVIMAVLWLLAAWHWRRAVRPWGG